MWHPKSHCSYHGEISFLILNFTFYFLFSGEGRLQEQRVDIEGWGDEWDWGTRCEIHKESS